MTETELRPVVLVVEDDPFLLRALTRVLEPLAADIHALSSAEAALTWLDAGGHAAVLLTDFSLGEMTGVALIHTVAQRSPDTRCMLYTGHSNVTVKLAHQPLIVLPKPSNGVEVQRLVSWLLESNEDDSVAWWR